MKTLKSFEFKAFGARGESKYDWDKILNGKINEMVYGEDYQGEDYDKGTSAFMSACRTQAGRRGQELSMNRVDDGVVLQAGEANEQAAEAFIAKRKEALQRQKANRKAKTESNGDTNED